MSNNAEALSRTHLLLGDNGLQTLLDAKVIIFGIGGVGSWCAESLVRTGLRHITIVDADRICASNLNRQLHATIDTIGEVKVDAMRNRLLSINPEAQITSIHNFYNADTAASFDLDSYDYVVDCIDTLQSKALLIANASTGKARFFSSMGAALKIDPTRIRVSDFWEVQGCPLGSKLRKLIRRNKMTTGKFLCVYGDEVLPNVAPQPDEPQNIMSGADGAEWNANKAVTNGSIVHITAIFGFTLAGLIIQDIYKRTEL